MIRDFNELVKQFKDLDGVDRTEQLMALGKQLPEMARHYQDDNTEIFGCTSQAYLAIINVTDTVEIQCTSNSYFVKGMLYILRSYIKDMSAEEILEIDHQKIMSSIGIENSVTSVRTNGFYATIKHLKTRLKALTMDAIDREQEEDIMILKDQVNLLQKSVEKLKVLIPENLEVKHTIQEYYEITQLVIDAHHRFCIKHKVWDNSFLNSLIDIVKWKNPNISEENLDQKVKILSGKTVKEWRKLEEVVKGLIDDPNGEIEWQKKK